MNIKTGTVKDMGLRTFVDGDTGNAVLYCSTTMRCLPFIFESEEDSEEFVEYVHGETGQNDLRRLPADEQERLFDAWQEKRACEDDEDEEDEDEEDAVEGDHA